MTLVKSWVSETGVVCAIVRNDTLGHLCGYVGIGRQHPWYAKRYFDCTLTTARLRGKRAEDFEGDFPIARTPLYLSHLTKRVVCDEDYCEHSPERMIEVHGGVTYSGYGFDPIPRDGEWFFGFDCAHRGDLIPGVAYGDEGVYRDEAYVIAECEKLAQQLVLLSGTE